MSGSIYTTLFGGGTTGNPATFSGIAIGGATPTNPQSLLSVIPPANASGVTAAQSYYLAQVAPTGAVTIPAGTAPLVASLYLIEPNITATGTVTAACTLYVKDAPTEGSSNYAFWVDSGTSRFDGDINMAATASDLIVIANTAAALEVSDGTTKLLALDTRNTVTGVVAAKFTSSPPTIAGAAGTTYSQVGISAVTVTDSTATGVTALNGIGLTIGTPTINQSGGAVVVTTVSTLYVQKPVAGASVTLTNNYIINTDTAGCFCTAAGVWTDTSGKDHKDGVKTVAFDDMGELLDSVRSVRYRHKHPSDGGFERFGVIAEELPDFLATPCKTGVAAVHLAGFALAAVKWLKAENDDLKARLDALEGSTKLKRK